MPLVEVAAARARVLRSCTVLPAQRTPLADALGLVTAEAVHAGEDVPPFANTAMDGYAVRAADTAAAGPRRPATLRLIGKIHAGPARALTIRPGECAQVATGAPIPAGADAVIMVEHTTIDGTRVKLQRAVK
ncbi:MAG: molybdopterin molybdenumtransferase MoeA, partial [Acidimicrobiales bacterium]